jgi:hypothetical protein
MTFKGDGRSDLEKLLDQFPREFTIDEVMKFFEWPNAKARTAIVNGQQTDAVRISREHRTLKGNSVAIYENVRWRQQWLKHAWGGKRDVGNVDGQEQRHS